MPVTGRRNRYRLKPYKCSAGKLTIGYGHNLDDLGITEEIADFMLEFDIESAKNDLHKVFGPRVNMFSYNRQNALIDMMFNLGINRFKGFRKMIAAIKVDDWKEASRQALDSKWSKQVKSRAIRDSILILEG